MLGNIHSFESFGTVDGPGIRFVVFMQGCPMRCLYCHNPDTWGGRGTQYTATEVASMALKYKNYYKGGGGVTVSGGEPLLQAKFVTELFGFLKKEGVHTALDTSGATFNLENRAEIDALLAVTDLVLLDIKHIDGDMHVKLTGRGNGNILEFAKYLSEIKKPVWIRHVLVDKITDDDVYLKALRAFIDGLANVEKVEVLPYHSMAESKYARLGIDYPLKGMNPPSDERIKNAKQILIK